MSIDLLLLLLHCFISLAQTSTLCCPLLFWTQTFLLPQPSQHKCNNLPSVESSNSVLPFPSHHCINLWVLPDQQCSKWGFQHGLHSLKSTFFFHFTALHARCTAQAFHFPLHKGRLAAQPCPLTDTQHTLKLLLLTSPRPETHPKCISASLVPDVAALEQHAAAALPCW